MKLNPSVNGFGSGHVPENAQEALPAVWTALQQVLPKRSPDFDHWWNLTGKHLALLFQAADYSTERQFESLLFHYHHIVPYCGPRPQADGSHKWRSILGIDGTGIEYSWKWNTRTSPPNIRVTLEAIDQQSGTKYDPLNQHASVEFSNHLAEVLPSVDLTWTNHFLDTLYSRDASKYAKEAEKGAHFHTTLLSAVEFLPSGTGLKTYFIPRQHNQADGPIPISQWEQYMQPLFPNGNKPFEMVLDFLNKNEEGKQLHAIMVSVDDVEPEKSRLKVYFHTPRTSWLSVREVMTLGGAISVPEEKLGDLKSFIYAVTGLPEDFSESEEAPLYSFFNPCAEGSNDEPAVMMGGYQYYIDVAPHMEVPEIKFFTPSRRYGPNDLQMAQGITDWMRKHERGAYCERFLETLQRLAEHRPLEKGKGIQTFIACLIKENGDLDITSYIGPEAWNPRRLESMRY